MKTYTAHGTKIEVIPRLFGIFLWVGFGFEVRIGDRTFLPRMDRLGWRTATSFEFEADGARVSGCVRQLKRISFLPRVSYSVTVGDAVIANDVQTLSRWPLLYLGWLLIGLITGFSLLGLAVFVVMVKAMLIPH